MKKLLIFLSCALWVSAPAMAQMPPPPPHEPPPRTITVSGEAHEEFAPDQAVLSVSLVSRDKNLHVAKQRNDAMVERLVDIAKKFMIPREKIATSNVVIAPQYTYDNGEQHFTDYMVSRSLRVTMDNLDTPEKLLSAAVDAKIDQINGLDYRLADPEAHAMPLRVKAFENARAKAEALAQAAGGKLGPALMITTEGSDMPPPWQQRPMPMLGMAKAAMPSVAPSLPGMMELRESVQVTFGLE